MSEVFLDHRAAVEADKIARGDAIIEYVMTHADQILGEFGEYGSPGEGGGIREAHFYLTPGFLSLLEVVDPLDLDGPCAYRVIGGDGNANWTLRRTRHLTFAEAFSIERDFGLYANEENARAYQAVFSPNM